jgi:ArsR family transcriptional regulator, arsenate/arsenite/antimonite-responsive transcriptional repressor
MSGMVDSVTFCRALGDETRQQILELLRGGELGASEIVRAFEMSQPTISHHLGILKQSGLLKSRKQGKQVFYSIDHDNVIECCGQLFAKLSMVRASAGRRPPRRSVERGSK